MRHAFCDRFRTSGPACGRGRLYASSNSTRFSPETTVKCANVPSSASSSLITSLATRGSVSPCLTLESITDRCSTNSRRPSAAAASAAVRIVAIANARRQTCHRTGDFMAIGDTRVGKSMHHAGLSRPWLRWLDCLCRKSSPAARETQSDSSDDGRYSAVLPEVMLSEHYGSLQARFWFWQPSRPWLRHQQGWGRALRVWPTPLLSPRLVSPSIGPNGRGTFFTAMRVFPDHWQAIHAANMEFPLPPPLPTRPAPIWPRFTTPVRIRWRFHQPLRRGVSAAGPKLPFPRNFEGCWQAHMTQPDSWSFSGRGPVVQGISPTDYVLCFHYAGNSADITFSSSAEYPVVSDWVESKVGVEKSQTNVLFSGADIVVLRTASSVPLYEKTFGFLPGPSGLITSVIDFHCTHLPNDKLRVQASVVQRCNNSHAIDCDGDVWIRESWHTEFNRQSS